MGAYRWAGYGEIDVDAETGRVGIAVVGLEQQRAGARIGGLDESHGQALRRPHRLETQKQCRKSDDGDGNALHGNKQQDCRNFR
jgi:hypothetical protein